MRTIRIWAKLVESDVGAFGRRSRTLIAASDLDLTPADLTRIAEMLKAIDVEGERYPENLMATVGR